MVILSIILAAAILGILLTFALRRKSTRKPRGESTGEPQGESTREPQGRVEKLLFEVAAKHNHGSLKTLPISAADWEQTKLVCLKEMKAVRSYCSLVMNYNFMEEALLKYGYKSMQWRVDHLVPDRWHVDQSGVGESDRILYDEWIEIAGITYQNTGIWWRNENELLKPDSNRFSVAPFVEILQQATPESIGRYGRGHDAYFVGVYPWELIAPIAKSCWGITNDFGESETNINCYIYIGATTNLIEKGQLIFDVLKKPTMQITTAFCCFNEKIVIEAPPFLNAEQELDGTLKVIDTRVVEMPLHN